MTISTQLISRSFQSPSPREQESFLSFLGRQNKKVIAAAIAVFALLVAGIALTFVIPHVMIPVFAGLCFFSLPFLASGACTPDPIRQIQHE